MSLKQKAVKGFIWSFIDIFSKQGLVFIIGIILARLLSPREFGLIGMTAVFIAFSQSFIDSGFGQALVRKKNCSPKDYSTVFFYNLIVGIVFCLLLIFFAEAISNFYKEPKLKLIIKVLSIGIIIKSLSIIHTVILIKRMDFKLQTKISVISSLFSGTIGIYMAYAGYGVWSLVFKTLAGFAITTVLLWYWNKWKPSLVFSKQSFKELFSFGSKLLLSGLINRIYENVYLLIIGKFFSAVELGYYTRAERFKNLPSKSFTSVIQRVSFPTLSAIQDDQEKLRVSYQKLIQSVMFFTFILMFGLIIMAKPIIVVLIGEKWLPSVFFLQLLCVVGIFFPWQEINKNMLKVLGRSDIILKLEVLKKILVVPVIIIGIKFGIAELIYGMILIAFISFITDSYFAGKKINYKSFAQFKDVMPSLMVAIFASALTYFIGKQINTSELVKLSIQALVYLTLSLGICEIFNIKAYQFLKAIIIEKVSIKK